MLRSLYRPLSVANLTRSIVSKRSGNNLLRVTQHHTVLQAREHSAKSATSRVEAFRSPVSATAQKNGRNVKGARDGGYEGLPSAKPIVQIANGTFYRQHPASTSALGEEAPPNPPLFPGLTLRLPSFSDPKQHWAILSPSSTIRTAFLQILRGQFICDPPTARSYPYLLEQDASLRLPERAIGYVGFDAEAKAFGGAYLSARYESMVEETDFSVERYLLGQTSLNPEEGMMREHMPDQETWAQIVNDLELERLFGKPVSVLSNGQTRRAKIGKALLKKPQMLCLDAAFIGLDPLASKHLSQVLHRLSEAAKPRIFLSLRPQDSIPEWITHLVYAGTDGRITAMGLKDQVLAELARVSKLAKEALNAQNSIDPDTQAELAELRAVGRHLFDNDSPLIGGTSADTKHDVPLSRDGYENIDKTPITVGEPIVEMQGVRVQYSGNCVLGDWQQDVNGVKKDGLWWTVRRGERWVICGGNGTGKTTLLSLVTSDHPQTYSAPVRIFQRSRLPEPGTPGISIFELQSRIGHASPEVHALFPKRLSIRRTLESAWADTPIMKPNLTADAVKRVEACLRWFADDLNPSPKPGHNHANTLDWASQHLSGELSFSSQRLLLFLRATIRNPDIVILDEAFSGMDDVVRDKCLLFLSRGQTMQLEYRDSRPRPVESDVVKKGEEVALKGLQANQALLCISHSMLEVPGVVRQWVCLPEPGTGAPRFGQFDGPVELDPRRWQEIWDRESV